MPATMTIAGSAVNSSETARPWITLVPWPVTEACADRDDRALASARIIFGDHDDQPGDDEADDAADEKVRARNRFCRRRRAYLAPADNIDVASARPPIDSTPVTIRPL